MDQHHRATQIHQHHHHISQRLGYLLYVWIIPIHQYYDCNTSILWLGSFFCSFYNIGIAFVPEWESTETEKEKILRGGLCWCITRECFSLFLTSCAVCPTRQPNHLCNRHSLFFSPPTEGSLVPPWWILVSKAFVSRPGGERNSDVTYK